ncbi:DUF309 domain-containing protein [Fictibacillus terranigra]|uniref:DUF309 domain-containing protein n=1 Tax=Fictibacillus terranigra TaxID=3058424 RepID=A0ABT8E9M9_9BACL|nr:DUF309 domain-containing protein [Fictibacillus sp. CENA-BCM004]MDN4074620.1 DUF309 domain-containing protein [Fictibacillus sp. CENA-BCM004]
MYPEAYIEYLAYFHGSRDFFECHEVLEEHWKDEGQHNGVWVGLIQIAVSLYHQRRGNYNGALRMMKSAIDKLTVHKEEIERLGLKYEALLEVLGKRLDEIERFVPFRDVDLPLADPLLINLCSERIEKEGSVWGRESNMDDELIVHKHKLRDRSEVIREREAQKKLRLKKNS